MQWHLNVFGNIDMIYNKLAKKSKVSFCISLVFL